MKTKTIVIVGSLMLACVAGGFLSGQWFASRQVRHELAETTYAWFEKGAFRAGAFDARASTWGSIWQEELGTQLKQALAASWSAAGNDSTWSSAFEVLRDQGRQSWSYANGTPESAQDDMIRYLCFRIHRAHVDGSVSAWPEVKALASYPRQTINRNREMIVNLVRDAITCGYGINDARRLMLAYAIHLSDLEWGRELSWLCLTNNEPPSSSIDNFTLVLEYLEEQANGEAGMLANTLQLCKPSREAQDASAEIIARLLRTEAIVQGTGRKAILEAWRGRLTASATRPSTQPTQ